MRLATVRTPDGTHAALLEDDELVLLDEPDVGAVLGAGPLDPDRLHRSGARLVAGAANLAPVVPNPSKIICVGLNYRAHILETGRELPEFPTLFAKFARTLTGPRDPIVLPAAAERVDWEVELAVVIGHPIRDASPDEARAAIAGYTVANDVSMRDWQYRTLQWLQGKAFEQTTPVGPYLVTGDEIGDAADLEIRCEVDGVVMQSSRTSELVFDAVATVAYASQIVTLDPGDLILTGTPGGVGEQRDPKILLQPGNVLRSVIEGIGECVNTCVAPSR